MIASSADPLSFSTPAELWRAVRAGEVTYVDVREPEAFSAGHVPGAINLPLYLSEDGKRRLNHDFLASASALRDVHHGPWVLGCRTGARSSQAAQVLRAAGFSQIGQFAGGWDGQVDGWGRTVAEGWRSSGMPASDDRGD